MAIPPAEAASKWQRIESGRWELLTDAGEKSAQQGLSNIASAHAAISADLNTILGPPSPSAPPVRILLFRSARDFRPFQRSETNLGLFQPGAERDYIFLLIGNEEAQRSLPHELTHRTLYRTSGRLPQWLEEGLSEYYSTIQRSGNRVTFGAPIDGHVKRIAGDPASGPWSNPEQFLGPFGPDSDSAEHTSLYYAQSWALVHLLMRGSEPHLRLREFIRLLREGLSQPTAFQQAFGRSPSQAIDEARQTVAARIFPQRTISVEPGPALSGSAKPLTELEWELVRASAFIDDQKLPLAEEIIQAAAKKWPKDPSVATGLGYLALSRGDYATARSHFESAIAAGIKDAFTYYEYAMLVRDTNGQEALFIQSLRDAVRISPSYAAAWHALGAALARKGEITEALSCFKQCVAILPRSSVYWEAYGRALLAAGDRAGARDAARSATASAATTEQSQMAQGLLRDADAPPPAKPSPKPAVTTPRGWKPEEGDAKVTGRLVLVDCDTSLLKFHIETQPAAARIPAQKTILGTEKPNQIMLRGAGAQKREFVCGRQATRPLVEAGYIAKVMETAPPPAPVEAAKTTASKTVAAKTGAAKKGAPAKKSPAPKPAPAKPAAPPVAGELVWLEFK
ncbi:MAG: tetratricopeptide repeat protein [Acidobacteria bacterium]|nr:tetratricopeptide repeat protein [Acidobacteriota bacterium]